VSHGFSDERDRAAHAGSFGAAADAYERGRPPYPPAAVDWLLAGAGPRMLDLGAGTGKLTRQLAARGLDVTAVEPSEGMRSRLAAAVPGVRALAGSAESIPLPDGSVDAVLVAQAWHWVDPERAVPEAARVLAPGGTLGLVWNIRDEREEWLARLGRLLHPEGAPPTSGVGVPDLADHPDLFAPVETSTVEWRHTLTPDDLTDLVASRSYVITLPDDDRTALLAEVRGLVAHHPALAGRDRIEMPYLTHCYRARRQPPAGHRGHGDAGT
jgi:SAM-dependent methyltransferase